MDPFFAYDANYLIDNKVGIARLLLMKCRQRNGRSPSSPRLNGPLAGWELVPIRRPLCRGGKPVLSEPG
jgi:hypothetical protein